MDIDQEIARVRSEGEALAHAAEAGPFDAPVPGCPGWDVEALLRHIGDIHRWAATVVRERIPERLQRDFEGPADREALLVWYLEGCVALVEALETTSPDDTFWFWEKRRMRWPSGRAGRRTRRRSIDVMRNPHAVGSRRLQLSTPSTHSTNGSAWRRVARRHRRVTVVSFASRRSMRT